MGNNSFEQGGKSDSVEGVELEKRYRAISAAAFFEDLYEYCGKEAGTELIDAYREEVNALLDKDAKDARTSLGEKASSLWTDQDLTDLAESRSQARAFADRYKYPLE